MLEVVGLLFPGVDLKPHGLQPMSDDPEALGEVEPQVALGLNPLADDEVEVHYHGTLINGEVFDSSVDRGEPSKFKVNEVISGWTEALQLMTVGDKWKLFIPSDLAYGETGNNSIGPNETLIFEVELIDITPKEIPELSIDGNSSSAEASIVIPDVDINATIPVLEANATESTDGNQSK